MYHTNVKLRDNLRTESIPRKFTLFLRTSKTYNSCQGALRQPYSPRTNKGAQSLIMQPNLKRKNKPVPINCSLRKSWRFTCKGQCEQRSVRALDRHIRHKGELSSINNWKSHLDFVRKSQRLRCSFTARTRS